MAGWQVLMLNASHLPAYSGAQSGSLWRITNVNAFLSQLHDLDVDVVEFWPFC